jgi:hypothetical protein
MPTGRYTMMDGDGSPVGTETFRWAPGPMGRRWFSEIETTDPTPHRERVDLAVDASWGPVRLAIATGEHELLLGASADELAGVLDGQEVSLPWGPAWHVDYLSPVFNAVTAQRLDGSAEIDVVYLEPVTCEPRTERQRYELLGPEEVATPVGRFSAARWRYTSLRSGWSRELWVAGDVVVRFDGLYELEAYEAGASGPRPLP